MRADAAPLRIEFVFVAVDDVTIGAVLQKIHNSKEGVRAQLIVVIEQPDEFSGGEAEGVIGSCADPFIFGGVRHFDPRGSFLLVLQARLHVRTSAAIVTNAKLPVLIMLA